MNEEQKMLENQVNDEYLTVFSKVPYSLISSEVSSDSRGVLDELTEICKYYKIYKKGVSFTTEGNNGDYISADLRFKMSASLINKEARFLFAEAPDISVKLKSSYNEITEKDKDSINVLNSLVKEILDTNNFEEILLKAAKDCFIGKRVASLVNFNEQDGVTIAFLPSTQFIYETKESNPNVLKKFVCFIVTKDAKSLSDKRIFMKKYELENDSVYLQEKLFDGAGNLIEEIISKQKILLDVIPASIFINDGLTSDYLGESEINNLKDYETWYSKLSNADIDAERKSMNPTKYLVDMASESTANLSSSAGAIWDLGSDQNLEKAQSKVGMLESSMNYSEVLKTTLGRIKMSGYEQVDMPDISLETMKGTITSGKALKAIYWPLIVRCKEKMKTWGPQLRLMVDIIIKGSKLYPDSIKRYIDTPLQDVLYEIQIEQNLPLPEDEIEEKSIDLSEVESKVMSRKTYMKKWRNLSDEEVNKELEQIAIERQMTEDVAFNQEFH